VAGNKGPCDCSIAPLLARVGRRKEGKRQKLVDWDKGSLTEQHMKRTVATTIPIRRI